MSQKKLDGIIESVRFNSQGRISCVRAYLRRGVVWSDRVILDRQELADRLTQGKRFATGERTLYKGSVFKTNLMVNQVAGAILTAGQTSAGDLLSGVPVF
jgi:hypothetical protein